MKPHEYAVFIGRFQPFHIGHLFVFNEALQYANKLIVLIGSSGVARSLRNPFTFAERKEMILASVPANIKSRIIVAPLKDYNYNDDDWTKAVFTTVTAITNGKSTALVGHNKDETTYYLQLFPSWDYREVGNMDGINATAVRKRYFDYDLPSQFSSDILLPETITWLQQFGKTETFIALAREFHAVERFKSQWKNTPYPVTFTTTDALVRYKNTILLITRKNYPGKDLLALPGGFLNPDESLFDCCLRELREETHLGTTTQELTKGLIRQRVFDDPKRSSRGRVVTHCYYFDLSLLDSIPSVHADDDAQTVQWVDIDTLDCEKLFEDHYFIIKALLES